MVISAETGQIRPQNPCPGTDIAVLCRIGRFGHFLTPPGSGLPKPHLKPGSNWTFLSKVPKRVPGKHALPGGWPGWPGGSRGPFLVSFQAHSGLHFGTTSGRLQCRFEGKTGPEGGLQNGQKVSLKGALERGFVGLVRKCCFATKVVTSVGWTTGI